MEAKEFFKKVGVKAVKSYVAAYEDHLTDDLKILVDAYELVESLGGLQECYKHIEGKFIKVGDWNFMDIKQAIELVEQCQ